MNDSVFIHTVTNNKNQHSNKTNTSTNLPSVCECGAAECGAGGVIGILGGVTGTASTSNLVASPIPGHGGD